MIIPTLPILVQTVTGRDVYAKPVLSTPALKELCSPVRLDFKSQSTTVRTDSGASQGHATEDAHVVVILVKPASKAVVDAVITILGRTMRVERAHPRYTAAGKLDHFQLELGPWA